MAYHQDPSSGFHIFNNNSFQIPRDDDQTDLGPQLAISLLFGLGAFTTFCILRPKWSGLYSARKKQINSASSLPDLPKSFLGWIPVLWRITDQQVLATAGLDAYVFLAFFKMAIKFLTVATILASVILYPIHTNFPDEKPPGKDPKAAFHLTQLTSSKPKNDRDPHQYHLWVYVVFVYVFSALATYFLLAQTKEVIHVRQEYLGGQCTITDRTFRLSGIPLKLRTEEALKDYVEGLRIGKVESITICRNWKQLDDLMKQRQNILRKLEEAYTVYRGLRKIERNLETLPIVQPEPPNPLPSSSGEETQRLINRGSSRSYPTKRPILWLRSGIFKLNRKGVDAIDHFTMKLEILDNRIIQARKKEYEATPLAFVTMDSVTSAQIAMQTVLDPQPGLLIARPAPAPSDIVWQNTYISRNSRMLRSWSISIFICILSIIWLIPVSALAALLNLKEIGRVWPGLAEVLSRNYFISSLVQNFLPTLVLTLLNVAVPYFYDWLSNLQGMISQSDVEVSVISKNFFFTFFNLFFVFTISGTAFNFHTLWDTLRGSFSDATLIAYLLARSLSDLAKFYINLIILQGIGMFPFRLLQFGSIALYPITLAGAKTPRDHAELVQPPVFKYGFYLPQPILVLVLCIVYSTLPSGAFILGFGLIYFINGYFTYKYQLLYAMDHPQHSTSQAWPLIFRRVVLGLIVFQLAMAGVLALRKAFTRSLMIVPLIIASFWLVWLFSERFERANEFIALKVIKERRRDIIEEAGRGETVDEEREKGQIFLNPSLVVPLEDAWITMGISGAEGENEEA